MIRLNDCIIKAEHFGAGELKFDSALIDYNADVFRIKWNYESDEEIIFIYFLISHLRSIKYNCNINLYMPYIPHARMDRVKTDDDFFTLKYFANMLNSLNINKITCLDAHSDVSLALINNIYNYQPDSYIYIVLNKIEREINSNNPDDIVIYFPDYGAYKRYSNLSCLKKYKKIYGEKVRNWETHRIEGLNIITNGIDLKDKTILMIDDIVSYGGTFYHSALKLNEYNVKNIYSFTSHTENVILDTEKGTYINLIDKGIIKKHFTTSSIYKKQNNHKSIIVI